MKVTLGVEEYEALLRAVLLLAGTCYDAKVLQAMSPHDREEMEKVLRDLTDSAIGSVIESYLKGAIENLGRV